MTGPDTKDPLNPLPIDLIFGLAIDGTESTEATVSRKNTWRRWREGRWKERNSINGRWKICSEKHFYIDCTL